MHTTVLLRDGVVDLAARRVWRADAVSRLTGTEVDVLTLLRAHTGRTVERQELLVRALKYPADSMSRAVDLCVHRLRSKVERDPANPVHLITIQGEGYRLVPATVVEDVRTNVLPARSPIVGRPGGVEEIRDRLEEGPVTLVGPAGVGKTRLAHAVAVAAGRSWAPAGSWWVDLAEIAPDGLEEAVRAVAAVAGVEAADPERLADVLADRGPSLVILDTCERCTEVAARLAEGLARGARVLLTSRTAVSGTVSLEVAPLAHEDAVALLLDRAQGSGAAARLDRAAVDRLVDAVDCLPLALELAAARLSSMPLARVEQELVRPLRLLRGGAGSGRQASVEASVRWSWEALAPADREALVQLAVFRSTIPDAAVASLLGDGATSALLATHLVRRVEGGVLPWHAVREFVVANADPEVRRRACVRHAAWIAGHAGQQLEALWGRGFREALDAIERSEGDLVAAEAHLAPTALASVVLARAELEYERARHPRVVALVDGVLPLLAADDPHRPSLVCLAAGSVGRIGDWAEAEARVREILTHASPRARVEAEYVMVSALTRLHRTDEAWEMVRAALRDAGDDPVLCARATGAQALLHFHDWEGEASIASCQRALDTVRAGGVDRFLAIATHNLAVTLVRAHRLDEAEPTLVEAVTHLVRNRRAHGIALMNLAILQMGRDPVLALESGERALESFRDAGSVDGARAALGLCGVYRAICGDVVDGLSDLDEMYAQHAGSRTPTATQSRALRAAILAFVGRRDDARAAFAEVQADLPAGLGLSEEDALQMVAIWLDGAPASAALIERLEAVRGDRRWIHGQLIRRFVDGVRA